MLFVVDSLMNKAKLYIESLGHTEEENPVRFERLVRAAYEEEKQRGHVLLKQSGFGRYMLLKAIGKSNERRRFEVQKAPEKNKSKSGRPEVGDWAQGTRPDYQGKKVHGQIMNVGRDGVVIRDDRGRRHRIRHEHLTKHEPRLSEKEWPKAAKALADAGEKVDPVSRFKKPEPKARPDKKLKRRITTLGKKHKDLDVKRALKEGTPEEIEQLVGHYKDRPVPKKMKKSSEYGGASCPRCGGDGGHGLTETNCLRCGHRFNPMTGKSLEDHGPEHVDCPSCGAQLQHLHDGTNRYETCSECGPGRCPHGLPLDVNCGLCRIERSREPRHEAIPNKLPDDISNMKSMTVFKSIPPRHLYGRTRARFGKTIKCDHCGNSVKLDNHWSSPCDACGTEYNGSGQRLASRSEWGSETCEHFEDYEPGLDRVRDELPDHISSPKPATSYRGRLKIQQIGQTHAATFHVPSRHNEGTTAVAGYDRSPKKLRRYMDEDYGNELGRERQAKSQSVWRVG